MKRFSKIAMSVATVSAMAAAMAISASAMTAEYTAPTGTETGKVNLTGVEATGAHQTVLVLNAVNLQEIAEGNIVQIDQKDDGTSFVSVPVGELTKGTYEVRIGGNGTVQTDTFTVDSKPQTETILVGDADYSTTFDSKDYTAVKNKVLGATRGLQHVGEERILASDKTTIRLVGDADYSATFDSKDYTAVKNKVLGATRGLQHVGEEIEVIKLN